MQRVDLMSALAGPLENENLNQLKADWQMRADEVAKARGGGNDGGKKGLINISAFQQLMRTHRPQDFANVSADSLGVVFYNIDGDSDGLISWSEMCNYAITSAKHMLQPRPAENIRSYSFSRQAPRKDNLLFAKYIPALDRIAVSSKHNPLQLLDPLTLKTDKDRFKNLKVSFGKSAGNGGGGSGGDGKSGISGGASSGGGGGSLGGGTTDHVFSAVEYVSSLGLLVAFADDMVLRMWRLMEDSFTALPSIVLDYHVSQIRCVPDKADSAGYNLSSKEGLFGGNDDGGNGATRANATGKREPMLWASTRCGSLLALDINRLNEPCISDEIKIHPLSLDGSVHGKQVTIMGGTSSTAISSCDIMNQILAERTRKQSQQNTSHHHHINHYGSPSLDSIVATYDDQGLGGNILRPPATTNNNVANKFLAARNNIEMTDYEMRQQVAMISDFCFVPPFDGRVVTAAHDHTLAMTDLEYRRTSIIGDTGTVLTMLAFDELHQYIAAVGIDNEISAWAAHACQNPRTDLKDLSRPHQGRVISIACVPRTPQVVTTDSTGLIKIWDLRTFRCAQSLMAGENGGDVSTSVQDGENLGTGGGAAAAKAAEEATSGGGSTNGSPRGGSKFRPSVTAATFVESNNEILLTDSSGLMGHEYDKGADPTLADENCTVGIAYNATANTFVTASAKDISIWDAEHGVMLTQYKHINKQDITAMTMDSKGRRIFLGFQNGTVELRTYHGGTLIKSIPLHTNEVTELAYSETHRTLVSSSLDGAFCLYCEHESSNPITRNRFGTSPILALAVNPSLGLIATGSATGKVTLTDFSHPRTIMAEVILGVSNGNIMTTSTTAGGGSANDGGIVNLSITSGGTPGGKTMNNNNTSGMSMSNNNNTSSGGQQQRSNNNAAASRTSPVSPTSLLSSATSPSGSVRAISFLSNYPIFAVAHLSGDVAIWTCRPVMDVVRLYTWNIKDSSVISSLKHLYLEDRFQESEKLRLEEEARRREVEEEKMKRAQQKLLLESTQSGGGASDDDDNNDRGPRSRNSGGGGGDGGAKKKLIRKPMVSISDPSLTTTEKTNNTENENNTKAAAPPTASAPVPPMKVPSLEKQRTPSVGGSGDADDRLPPALRAMLKKQHQQNDPRSASSNKSVSVSSPPPPPPPSAPPPAAAATPSTSTNPTIPMTAAEKRRQEQIQAKKKAIEEERSPPKKKDDDDEEEDDLANLPPALRMMIEKQRKAKAAAAAGAAGSENNNTNTGRGGSASTAVVAPPYKPFFTIPTSKPACNLFGDSTLLTNTNHLTAVGGHDMAHAHYGGGGAGGGTTTNSSATSTNLKKSSSSAAAGDDDDDNDENNNSKTAFITDKVNDDGGNKNEAVIENGGDDDGGEAASNRLLEGISTKDSVTSPTFMLFDNSEHLLWIGDTRGCISGWKICPLLKHYGLQWCSYPATPMFKLEAPKSRKEEVLRGVMGVVSMKAHEEEVLSMCLATPFGVIISSGDDRRVLLWNYSGEKKGELSMGRLTEGMVAGADTSVQTIQSASRRDILLQQGQIEDDDFETHNPNSPLAKSGELAKSTTIGDADDGAVINFSNGSTSQQQQQQQAPTSPAASPSSPTQKMKMMMSSSVLSKSSSRRAPKLMVKIDAFNIFRVKDNNNNTSSSPSDSMIGESGGSGGGRDGDPLGASSAFANFRSASFLRSDRAGCQHLLPSDAEKKAMYQKEKTHKAQLAADAVAAEIAAKAEKQRKQAEEAEALRQGTPGAAAAAAASGLKIVLTPSRSATTVVATPNASVSNREELGPHLTGKDHQQQQSLSSGKTPPIPLAPTLKSSLGGGGGGAGKPHKGVLFSPTAAVASPTSIKNDSITSPQGLQRQYSDSLLLRKPDKTAGKSLADLAEDGSLDMNGTFAGFDLNGTFASTRKFNFHDDDDSDGIIDEQESQVWQTAAKKPKGRFQPVHAGEISSPAEKEKIRQDLHTLMNQELSSVLDLEKTTSAVAALRRRKSLSKMLGASDDEDDAEEEEEENLNLPPRKTKRSSKKKPSSQDTTTTTTTKTASKSKRNNKNKKDLMVVDGVPMFDKETGEKINTKENFQKSSLLGVHDDETSQFFQKDLSVSDYKITARKDFDDVDPNKVEATMSTMEILALTRNAMHGGQNLDVLKKGGGSKSGSNSPDANFLEGTSTSNSPPKGAAVPKPTFEDDLHIMQKLGFLPSSARTPGSASSTRRNQKQQHQFPNMMAGGSMNTTNSSSGSSSHVGIARIIHVKGSGPISGEGGLAEYNNSQHQQHTAPLQLLLQQQQQSKNQRVGSASSGPIGSQLIGGGGGRSGSSGGGGGKGSHQPGGTGRPPTVPTPHTARANLYGPPPPHSAGTAPTTGGGGSTINSNWGPVFATRPARPLMPEGVELLEDLRSTVRYSIQCPLPESDLSSPRAGDRPGSSNSTTGTKANPWQKVRHGHVPFDRRSFPPRPPAPAGKADARTQRIKLYQSELSRCLHWNKQDLEEKLVDAGTQARNWSSSGLRTELFHQAFQNRNQQQQQATSTSPGSNHSSPRRGVSVVSGGGGGGRRSVGDIDGCDDDDHERI